MLANPHPHPHPHPHPNPHPHPHPTPNQAELEELQGTITSVEDLLRNEMTRSIVEVVEAEVGERVVETLDTVVQLNETESSVELKALLRQPQPYPLTPTLPPTLTLTLALTRTRTRTLTPTRTRTRTRTRSPTR